MTGDPLAVQFKQALDLLDELTDNLLPLGGVAGVYRDRVELWKKTARSLVNDHLKDTNAGFPALVPPVVNPLDVLTCDACWHPASQHGFVFDPHDWSISYDDLTCSFPDCRCKTFSRVTLPPFTPGTEMVP